MKGFAKQFKDLPDYILKITYQIWENKDVESIMQYYAENIPVRSQSVLFFGQDAVVKETKATQKEFPDRQLLGEDVIWIGNEENGFLSSHRILSKATHQNDGTYGPATGKKIVYSVIADCACRNNQVYDEWLVRDQGAIVRQIGLEPKKYAANLMQEEGGAEKCSIPFNENTPIGGDYTSPAISNENTGTRYADILKSIMNKDIGSVENNYDRAIQQEQPGGFTAQGTDEVSQFWDILLSAFSDAKFSIEHISFTDAKNQPKKAAIRWALVGSHSGKGNFGDPSNAQVYIMGISHAEFGPRGIKNEWVLFDETMIWKQILMKTG